MEFKNPTLFTHMRRLVILTSVKLIGCSCLAEGILGHPWDSMVKEIGKMLQC